MGIGFALVIGLLGAIYTILSKAADSGVQDSQDE